MRELTLFLEKCTHFPNPLTSSLVKDHFFVVAIVVIVGVCIREFDIASSLQCLLNKQKWKMSSCGADKVCDVTLPSYTSSLKLADDDISI
jgi:hypothetical protein